MKRQANALTAVLENWQDVENAIDIYANSAGSALRENEIYLDSWEAKSKAVSAAWNELVNSLLDSNWIKGFLDGAQNVLSWLTNTNALIPVLAGLIGGVLTLAIQGLVKWIQGLKVALTEVNLLAGGIPLLIGLITTLAVGVVTWGINASDTAKQIENLTNKIEEQQKAIDELNSKEKEATDLYKEYASLMSKSNAYGLSNEEKENLLKISNDLVDTYGLEVEGIDAVTGAYKIGANAINDYVEALRRERNIKLEEQTGTRNERIKTNIRQVKANTKDSKSLDDKEVQDIIERARKHWSESGAESDFSALTLASDALSGYSGDAYEQLEENIAKYLKYGEEKYLEKFERIATSETTFLQSKTNGIVNNIVKDLLDNIKVDNADMLDSNSESLLTQMLTPYLTTVDWDKFDQDDFEAKVKEFATHASESLSEVATKLQTSQTKMMSGELNLSGYEDMYSTLQNKAGLLKQMLDQGIIDQKSYEEQVSQIYSQVANNIGLSMVEIAGKISETDKQSQQNFKNVADSFVALENQFRQGKISSVEYLTSITETIENMDFTKTFGENTEAAQQFFSTLANKSANILQDTITQFESGNMSVKDYGDNLKNFAKQQKELAKNAIEEAKALGMSEDAVKELTDEYDKNSKAIDDAVKKWEELDGINAYLDDNIETLRTATNVASEAYQSFATGLYNEFTKLSDNMQSQIISDMQKMEGLGHITAENLKDEMAKSTSASAGLASAVASNTNDVFKNLANNGGKVLTALGNAIKNFKYTITFNPNAKFSGGEFNLIKWAKTGGQEGIKLPSISWDITGKAGGGAEGLGEALSGLGQSLSVASDFLDISDYGGGSGGGGNGNGNGGGSGGGGKGSGGSDKNKPDYEDPTDAIINRINLRAKELEQEEQSIQNAIEIAELENDDRKQISLTNDLINNRKQRVEELNKANIGLHNEAEYLRNSNLFYDKNGNLIDTNTWFNSLGEETEAYKAFYNSQTSKEQERIKSFFENVSKYKEAYKDNADDIIGINKELVEDYQNSRQIWEDYADDQITDIEHQISLREGLGVKDYDADIYDYEQIKQLAHQRAEEWRAAGLDDNSPEVQKWQKIWLDADKNIRDTTEGRSDDLIEDIEHALEVGEALNTLSLDDKLSYYEKIKEIAHQRADDWRAMGYDDNSPEVQKWQKTWLDADAKIKDAFSDTLDKIERATKKETDRLQELADKAGKLVEKYEALKQVKSSQFDFDNSMVEALQDIDNQLATSLVSAQYLDPDERSLIFNEEDYKLLSGKIKDLQEWNERAAQAYWNEINDLGEDEFYLKESITAEYERQLALKNKELEVYKAEVDVKKKEQALNNVLAEKNVKMLVDGRWTWVADADKVRQATEEANLARNRLTNVQIQKDQQLVLNGYDESIANANAEKAAYEQHIENINDATEKMREAYDDYIDPVEDIGVLVKQLRDKGVSEFNNALSDLTDAMNNIKKPSKEYSSFPTTYSSPPSSPGGSYNHIQGDDGRTYEVMGGSRTNGEGTAVKGKDSNGNTTYTNNYGEIVKTVKTGYASGTKSAVPGWHKVDENGQETYVSDDGVFHNFSGGEMVFNNDQVQRLFEFSKYAPQNMMAEMVSKYATPIVNLPVKNTGGGNITYQFNGGIHIDEVADYNDFMLKITQKAGAVHQITKNE